MSATELDVTEAAIKHWITEHPRSAQLKRVLRGVIEDDPELDPMKQYERAVTIEQHLPITNIAPITNNSTNQEKVK